MLCVQATALISGQLASPMEWMDLPAVSESDLTAFVTSSVDEVGETDDIQIRGHRIV